MNGANEERRLVTVLFCDLVGFTPLSEQLDPENVRDIQVEYFSKMTQQIERYGGTVEKYAGDAVLALFGVPVSHEDDPERAVLCALGMLQAIDSVAPEARRQWNELPAIRVGINTGHVIAGNWEAGGPQQVAVTGDAVNTAARIQSVAERGEILVGAETMELSKRRFRYGARRDVALKGKSGVTPLWPVLGLRETLGERWEGNASPFVGRAQELSVLFDAWARAAPGEGQLVSLIGESGVGKSRLLTEFMNAVAPDTSARIVQARCVSYGQTVALGLLADLVRSLFGVSEADTPGDVAVKLGTRMRLVLSNSDSREADEVEYVLRDVLGLPLVEDPLARANPQVRRQILVRSVRAILAATAAVTPVLLILEDVHWIDEPSEEVLFEVLADVPGLRMMVLALQRPGWSAPWSGWSWPERVALRPLPDVEAGALAEAVLGGSKLHPQLQEYLHDRAAGNPYFVEELVRALQETDGLEQTDGSISLVSGAAARLPSTLGGILLARLDRLDPDAKHLAQVGSVIGRSFAVRLLGRVLERDEPELEVPLAQLQRAEVAFPRRDAELEYVFKHATMRDAAYDTLMHRRRQDLHARTASALASLYPGDEYVEMTAYHFGMTVAPEAAEWLERAGDHAARVYANASAIDHFEGARQRLASDDAVALARLHEKLGTVLSVMGRYDEALVALHRAVEIHRQMHDLESAGRVTAGIGVVHRWQGTPDDGVALILPLLDLLAWSGPSEAVALLHLALAGLFGFKGNYREQAESARRAGETARAIGDDALLGQAEERRAVAEHSRGNLDEGCRLIDAALPLIRVGGDLEALYRALTAAGVFAFAAGDPGSEREYFQQAFSIIQRIGSPDQITFALANLGTSSVILGDWDRGRRDIDGALAMARSRGHASGLLLPLQARGALAVVEGDWERARTLLGEALDIAEINKGRQGLEIGESWLARLALLEERPHDVIDRLEPLVRVADVTGFVLPPLVQAYVKTGNIESARRVADDALRRARSGWRVALPEALLVHGMVLVEEGRPELAEHALLEALEIARATPLPDTEASILCCLGELHVKREQRDLAHACLADALLIYRKLGAVKRIAWTEAALVALSSS